MIKTKPSEFDFGGLYWINSFTNIEHQLSNIETTTNMDSLEIRSTNNHHSLIFGWFHYRVMF